ncbi:hypothetical protein SEVIR_4G096250v4 [Setaria viridis]
MPPPASTDVPRHERTVVGPSIVLRSSCPFSSHLSPHDASHHFVPLRRHRPSTTARRPKPPPRRPPPSPRTPSSTAAPTTSSTAALTDGVLNQRTDDVHRRAIAWLKLSSVSSSFLLHPRTPSITRPTNFLRRGRRVIRMRRRTAHAAALVRRRRVRCLVEHAPLLDDGFDRRRLDQGVLRAGEGRVQASRDDAGPLPWFCAIDYNFLVVDTAPLIKQAPRVDDGNDHVSGGGSLDPV